MLIGCADESGQVVAPPPTAPAAEADPPTGLSLVGVTRLQWTDGELESEPMDVAAVARFPMGPLRTLGQPLLCVLPGGEGLSVDTWSFLAAPQLECGSRDAERIPTARSRLTRSQCLLLRWLFADPSGYVTVLPLGGYPGLGALQSPPGLDDYVVHETITVAEREYHFSQGAIVVAPGVLDVSFPMLIDMPYGGNDVVYVLHLVEQDECQIGLVEYRPEP